MEPTYHFKDGRVYTVANGRVSSVVRESEFENMDRLAPDNIFAMGEARNKGGFTEPVPCPQCGELCEPDENGFCPSCPHCGFSDGGGSDYAGHPPEVADNLRAVHEQERMAKKQAGPGQFMEPAPEPSSEEPDMTMPEIPDDLQEDLLADVIECPACGETADESDSFCSKCGEPLSETGLSGEENDLFGDEEIGLDEEGSFGARPLAKTVTTPSGLKGTVMNRVAGLWGDEVTVRFSNGRVKKMPVTAEMKFSFGGEDRNEAFAQFAQDAAKRFPDASMSLETDPSGQIIVYVDDPQVIQFAEDEYGLYEQSGAIQSGDYFPASWQSGLMADLPEAINFPEEPGDGIGGPGATPAPAPQSDPNEDLLSQMQAAPQGIVASLRRKLAASVPGDAESLKQRKQDLEEIQHTIRNASAKASHAERKALHSIATEASYETKSIDDAIQHLVELEGRAFQPTSGFQSIATEQASLGKGDGGWLTEVLSSMDEESEGTDYKKLMEEGPLAFVAGSDDATVANSGTTRIAASRYIRSFTSAAAASTTEAQRGQYERQFLARVEEARKNELKSRKTATKKEASQVEKQASESPDASLFL
jgi:hypothetical protein